MWSIPLDNQTAVPVKITSVSAVLRGEKTGIIPSPSAITLQIPKEPLPANQITPVTLDIKRNQLSPDRYQGILRFTFEGSDTPLSLSADLSVRDAPFWAIVIIVGGILVGRLARSMETQTAKTQIKLASRLTDLRAKISTVTKLDSYEFIRKQFQEVNTKVNKAEEAEEILIQALSNVEAEIDFLISLEKIEKDLQPLGLDVLKDKIQEKLDKARKTLIEENSLDKAKSLQDEAEVLLRKAQEDSSMGMNDSALVKPILVWLENYHTQQAFLDATRSVQHPNDHWGWLAKLLSWVSGLKPINAEIRYWLIRPLLAMFLLIILALLGLQTLYVNAGATFGVSGLYDYLGLFLWGISADVASRGLTNLTTQGN
ncbi:hypothetical protein [Nostoc sp.]|uniref:hypothetical protein n=1 Tax=Nostoc sp. TaxID=1180 RepID=UPI002FF4F2ED